MGDTAPSKMADESPVDDHRNDANQTVGDQCGCCGLHGEWVDDGAEKRWKCTYCDTQYDSRSEAAAATIESLELE